MDTSNRSTKIKLVAGAAAALALAIAVGATGAIAASRALSADEESKAVIDDAAGRLGVEPSALSDALKQALENRVDRAVEDGRLTEEQGAMLKERIDSAELPLGFGRFGHEGFGKGMRHGHLAFGGLDAAATYLGLSESELHSQLREGKTLADVAEAEGKSVDGLVAAMVAAAKEKIDEAVADGRITKERAAALEDDLEKRMTDLVNGELRQRGVGRHFGRGFGSSDGPPAFRGPRA